MQIKIAKGIGFCFGVEKAVNVTKELLKSGKKVFTDDDIVHNKQVMEELERLGLSYDNGDIYLIRAHGLPKEKIEKIKKDHRVVDLTCNIVYNLFKTVEVYENKGYQVVVYGKITHPEMIALKSYSKNAIITMEPLVIKSDKIFVASQTTMSYKDFENFYNKLKDISIYNEFKVFNSICNITHNREIEVEKLSKEVDLMIVVGGKHSSNTRKLFNIASQHTKAIHIETIDEIKEIPKGVDSVGIISGTSTPKEIVEEIAAGLKKLGGMLQMENNFEKLLDSYLFDNVRKGEIVEAVVLRKGESEIFVDFGWKSEGVVTSDELVKDVKDYKIGEKLSLILLRKNDDEGIAYLSEKIVYSKKLKEILKEKFEKGEKIIGKINSEIKGGYKVLIENTIQAFLPKSESMIFDGNIPKSPLEFKIIKFEERGKRLNIILSRKAFINEQKEKFFNERKEGDIIEGIVKKIEKFGAFVRIFEGIDGLLPNSEVSYDTSLKVEDVLSEGQSVKLYIKKIDKENRKILLSLKELMPDPWQNVTKKYKVGDIVSGKVKNILSYGFYVNLEPGVDGLVHIDDIFWGRRGKISDIVSVGDIVKVMIKEIDPNNKKMRLSYKEVEGDPWENIEEKYPVGNTITGTVSFILDKGVIVEIERGISGFCPISEISWNYISSVKDVLNEGQKVKAVITELDKENRKMRLSIKRVQENPWKKFKVNHKIGDIVAVKVIKELKSGYVGACENVEIYLPKSHVLKEITLGDELKVKIIQIKEDGEILRITASEKELENEKVIDSLKEEFENERYTTIERKVDNANSIDSGQE
jgi:4-hydroxy-3-methylbut-2-enyl diphosphate reductase